MSLIESPRFLFSTNGARFGHPDEAAVQRIVERSVHRLPMLHFNYSSRYNSMWADEARQAELGYRALYNQQPEAPMVITL
jgi:hypothetical protein